MGEQTQKKEGGRGKLCMALMDDRCSAVGQVETLKKSKTWEISLDIKHNCKEQLRIFVFTQNNVTR